MTRAINNEINTNTAERSTTDLVVEGMICGYRERNVLKKIDFRAQPGELFVILGANGAGKSTLLHAIAGQIPIRAGSVSYGGANLTQLKASARAKTLSLMPQFESKEVSLSVQEIVLLGRSPHRGWFRSWSDDDKQIVEESLRLVGLHELRERPISSLSGGEWRRMMLARALAQQCPVMLLDEPTEGLDLRFQYECLEHVRRVARERKIIAIVTLHDLNQAATFADRVGLVADGQMIANGPPTEVLTTDLISATYGLHVQILQHPQLPLPLIVPEVSR